MDQTTLDEQIRQANSVFTAPHFSGCGEKLIYVEFVFMGINDRDYMRADYRPGKKTGKQIPLKNRFMFFLWKLFHKIMIATKRQR